jgi:hypothetical protein
MTYPCKPVTPARDRLDTTPAQPRPRPDFGLEICQNIEDNAALRLSFGVVKLSAEGGKAKRIPPNGLFMIYGVSLRLMFNCLGAIPPLHGRANVRKMS